MELLAAFALQPMPPYVGLLGVALAITLNLTLVWATICDFGRPATSMQLFAELSKMQRAFPDLLALLKVILTIPRQHLPNAASLR